MSARYSQEDSARRLVPEARGKTFFTPVKGAIARTLLEELSAPPDMVYSDWDAGIDDFLYCGASVHGVRAIIEQKKYDGLIHLVVYVSIALTWNPDTVRPRSISRLAASAGAPSASVVLCVVPRLAFLFGPQGARKLRQGC